MTGTQRLLSDAELFYAAIISDGAFTADSEGDFYLKSSGEDIPYDELFAVLRNVEKAVLEKLLANIPTAWRIDHKSVCGNGITTEKVVAEDWLKSDPEIVTPLYANSIDAQARQPDWRFIQKGDQRIIDGQVMTCSDPEIGRWQGSEAFAIEVPKESPAQPYSLRDDPAGIRALTADAITGALVSGYQNISPPPDSNHWLAPFWEIGRESGIATEKFDEFAKLTKTSSQQGADKVDAERYRFIRDGEQDVWCSSGDDLMTGDNLDAAIDAARKEANK